MKKITTQLFLLYCATIQTSWGSPAEVKTLLPTKNPIYKTATPVFYKRDVLLFASIVKAGGYGGNIRIGKLIYSGNSDNLPVLNVSRAPENGRCSLVNENARVFYYRTNKLIQFDCISPDPEHDNLYWNGNLGEVNGGYSPENDALYAADIITNMFKDWYDISPVVDKNGLKLPIHFNLHLNSDNAYSGSNEVDLGDGRNEYHPLTSLSVIGHMVGNIFTEQHSNLSYFNDVQGGISIAFSCMTAMAAEFYATHKNTWQVGADVSKNGEALHYMDKPSKNCHGSKPGNQCDIDTMGQFYSGIDSHYSSGIFNRAFYLLATTNGWDTHKAYDIFIQANRYHWNRKTDFHSGACDAITSAKELGYETKSVMIAFSAVGIDTRDC